MKPAIHDRLVQAGASRRELLKTVSGLGAMAALGAFGTPLRSAFAQADLRAAILKVPGIGMGQPTDADWQKVGEMCLGPTKQIIKEGLSEYFGVKHGALVRSVSEGSVAAKAGIKAGDVIIAVNGTAVDEPSDVRRAIQFIHPVSNPTKSPNAVRAYRYAPPGSVK